MGHTSEALQEAVIARLDGPERRVLKNLIDAYPDALTKQELGERSGFSVESKGAARTATSWASRERSV